MHTKEGTVRTGYVKADFPINNDDVLRKISDQYKDLNMFAIDNVDLTYRLQIFKK